MTINQQALRLDAIVSPLFHQCHYGGCIFTFCYKNDEVQCYVQFFNLNYDY